MATGNELWELLHLVLPRYLRITVKHTAADISISGGSDGSNNRKSGHNITADGVDLVVRQLQEENPDVVLLQIPWMPNFVAIPGYVTISSLNLPSGEGVSIFPMDIASGIPPLILAGPGAKSSPQKVMDLCCCPGGKFLMLSDFLAPAATIVGVDISKQRMYTTKNLVHKYLNAVYMTKSVEHIPPRMLLFCSDGTTFSTAMNGDLLYDSRIGLDEIRSSGYKRKRNKSMRGREEKRLKEVKSQLAAAAAIGAIGAIGATATPTGAVIPDVHTGTRDSKGHNHTQEDECSLSAEDHRHILIEGLTSCSMDKFDAVLVDAQCTHDSSYRHLRYVSDGNAEVNELTDATVWGNTCRNHKNLDSVESDDDVYALQRRLLANGFANLVEGGELVYSTCSAEIEQNEHVVEWLLEQEQGKVELVPVAETWCQGRGKSSDSPGDDDNESSSSHCKCNDYLVGKDDTDLSTLVHLLTEQPVDYRALLDFLRHIHTNPSTTTNTSTNTNTNLDTNLSKHPSSSPCSSTSPRQRQRLLLLAEEMCRYVASFMTPPGREGGLVGTAYFGMWAGTSGLFLSRIRKVSEKKDDKDDHTFSRKLQHMR